MSTRKFPLSSLSFSLILDLTNLSRNVFGLRNATRGGFGNTAFNVGDFSIKQWADFKTLNTIFNAAWKVRTNVLLFFWCFFLWGNLLDQLIYFFWFLVLLFLLYNLFLPTNILKKPVSNVYIYIYNAISKLLYNLSAQWIK